MSFFLDGDLVLSSDQTVSVPSSSSICTRTMTCYVKCTLTSTAKELLNCCVDLLKRDRTRTQSTILSHAHFLPNSISWVIANNEPSTLPDWVSPVWRLSARSRMLLLPLLAPAYRCALYSFWCWWWTCRLVQLFYCWPLLIEWVAFSARPSGHLCSFIVLINQSRLPIVLAVLVRVLYTSTFRGVVNPTILSALLVS